MSSIATALGARRAWAVQAFLFVAIAVIAVLSAVILGAQPDRVWLVTAAGCVPIVGAGLGRGGGTARRERAWQLEAIGIAAVGVAWIWVLLG